MSYRGRYQRSRQHNNHKEESAELVLLRATHSQNLLLLNELFPDWSDEDLLFTLQDTYGDLDLTVSRISEGYASQWGEVKSRKAKKESPNTPRPKQRPQLRNTDSPKSQVTNVKNQTLPKAKSIYHTDENGLLVASTETQNKDKPKQLSSEETLCETLDLPPNSDWAQDLPSPLRTTFSKKDSSLEGRNSSRGKNTEDRNRNNKDVSYNQNSRGERGYNNFGSTRGQKYRGRGGKFNQGSSHSLNGSNDSNTERGNFSRRRGNGVHSSASNRNSAPKEKEPSPPPKPAPAPVNTWAKIASRATLPKPEPVKVAPAVVEKIEPPTSEILEPTILIESTSVISAQQDNISKEEIQSVVITSESISSGKEFSALAFIESLTNSDCQQLNPSPRSPNKQTPAVLIPNVIASKMGDISKKFGKMNLSDLGFDITSDEPTQPLVSDDKFSPALVTETLVTIEKSLDSSNIGDSLSPVPAIASVSNNNLEIEVRPETFSIPESTSEVKDSAVVTPILSEQDIKPKTNDQTLANSASIEIPSSQAPVQTQVATSKPQAAPGQALTTTQGQDSLYHQPINQYYPHSQGYNQMPLSHGGAPGHQPPMQAQMMHPQGQANYMPYYPYPYGPTHYNPYQANNYTHQFAQKSLNGNYDDNNPNSFGQLAPGAGPSHPQENGNVPNHGYDKSSHGKHKAYPDPSNDSGISGHGPPMNYGNFGYGGMPNYQPSGTPGEGPIYYPHPYYTQPNHNMFPGYPGSSGLQHVPPHLQHSYGNSHPLQQHHQGHQPHSQQQTHYSSHQPSNTSTRYQNWNN